MGSGDGMGRADLISAAMLGDPDGGLDGDRKSTRLNSSHAD